MEDYEIDWKKVIFLIGFVMILAAYTWGIWNHNGHFSAFMLFGLMMCFQEINP